MNEEQLMLVEEGLSSLMSRFKKNSQKDDARRLKLTTEAKAAIRKVILSVAIKGDVKAINPITDGGKKIGWEVTDFNNKVIKYFG